jgi:ABC-type multidrug transport system fused ATPase/permease subunit
VSGSLRSVARFLRGSRRRLLASVGTTLVQSGLLVLVGLLIRRAFDREIPGDHIGALAAVGAAILGLALLSAALAVLTRYLVLAAVKDSISRLRVALLERLNTLPATWYDRADAGSLHATVVQDSERLDMVGNALAGLVAPAVVVGTGLSVALLVINPLLFGILAISLPVLAVLTRRLDSRVRQRTRVWQLAFDRFSSRVQRSVRARPLIRAQAAEPVELDAGRLEVVELSESGRAMAWLHGAYTQLHGTVATVSGVIVLVVGGALVARGSMSLGSLLSFYTLVALLRSQGSVVLATLPQAISGRESLARLVAILDAPDREPYRGSRLPSLRRSLTLHDVEFGYTPGVPVLRGFTLELERGERVALIGPNGAGKTTVAALALGLYRPWRGWVAADGIAYDELDIRALRRLVGLVPQRPILLPASVAENIAYGGDPVDPARVREAAALATVDDFVDRLEHGYETHVGEDGDLLSGGERQRIALARALVRNPAFLILDEPTSSLDREAVSRVLANLRALAHDPAVLVISHDWSVIDDADRVVELSGAARPAPARSAAEASPDRPY